jgi:ribonuclease T2
VSEQGKTRLRPLRPFALALALLVAGPAPAQDRAGEFDHFLLALTWMPAFCVLEDRGRDDPRCAAGRRAGWMLHGLWPQHRGGDWPEYCPTRHRSPSRRETAAQADLYGSSGAAWHQWHKHGRCTGLSAADYYALSRRALASLRLPELFERVDRPQRLAPQAVEDAFLAENPGLSAEMLVVTCRRGLLAEVRLCLTRDLAPRPCDPELRACPLRTIDLLPPR